MVIEPRLFGRAARSTVAILNDVYPTIVDSWTCSFEKVFPNLTSGTFCYRLETHRGSVGIVKPKKHCIWRGTLGLNSGITATSSVAKLTHTHSTQIARHGSTVLAAHYFSVGQAHTLVNLHLTLWLLSPYSEPRSRNAKSAWGWMPFYTKSQNSSTHYLQITTDVDSVKTSSFLYVHVISCRLLTGIP
jgi:hypothetical protein